MADIIPTSNQLETPSSVFSSVVGPPGSKNCEYEKVRDLGSGSFGKALLVRRVSDGALLVAKRMDIACMSDKDKRYVMAEIQCLAGCDHFAIIKYIKHYLEEDHVLIVMEFADAGDLNMQIKHRAHEGYMYFEEHEVGYTFVQLALAVDHIHRRRMLHRDIKGANVMLMTNGVIKLGDFGFSHKYDHTLNARIASTFCGTPYYLAPELWSRQRYGNKADMWAMGVLLFEMMALRRPYVGQGMKALSESVMNNKRDCQLPSRYSSSLKEICERLLQPDPTLRPSCGDLFRLPHMIKLLTDFETSVDNSQLVNAAMKRQIHENIRDIRQSYIEAGPSHFGATDPISTDVYYEGNVRKESSEMWKERFLVLRNGGLVISRQKGDKETKPLSVAFISSVVAIPEQAASSPGVFAINLSDGKTMWFQALPPETSTAWVDKIRQAMGIA